MRKSLLLSVLVFWVAGHCPAQTTPAAPATPASSASPGGEASESVISEIIESMSVYPPAWSSYFLGQSRPSRLNKKLIATIRSDGRIAVPGIARPIPIPVGRSWSHLDMRNDCMRGYVYRAYPIFSPEEAFKGRRPHDWGWEDVFHKGNCV